MFARRRRIPGALASFFLIPLLAVLLTSGSTAFAQQAESSRVSPTERQVELNDAALAAMNESNYVRAASLLEESNHLGELNVTYLNLGRAYQHMGRCEAARKAFEQVPGAPKVESLAPDFVDKKAKEYMAELDESCEAGEVADRAEPVEPIEEPSDNATARDTWGYVTLGSGVGLLAASGALAWQAATLRDDISGADADADGFADGMSRRQALAYEADANLYDSLALGGVVAGGVLVGVGAYLLVSTEPQVQTVVLVPGLDSFSASWHVRF